MLGPGKRLAEALFPPKPPLPPKSRLYRNDLQIDVKGNRKLRFTDVTAQSGIDAQGYGMGVAAGDYDNDGWVDLYITNFGPNQMWRNEGDGTFSNVTESTGKAGQPDSAIESYTEALELAPTNARGYYNLGVLLTELGSEQQAIGHYRAAVRFDPSLQRGHFHLANLLMRAKRYEEALPHYAAVVKDDPRNAFARLMHSIALISTERYREALDGLEEGHKAMPDNTDFAHTLARLLAASPDSTIRDGSRAVQLTQKLLENQSSVDVDHAATLAMALAEVGEFSKAVQLQRNLLAEVERAGRHDLARSLRENLRLYESRQACRIPWPEDVEITVVVDVTESRSYTVHYTW